MVEFVKGFLVPGSISFLVIGLAVALLLLYGNKWMQRWGRRWLTALLLAYAFLSLPVGADLVSAPLVWRYGALTSKDQAKGVDTVVVLSNGSEVDRAYNLEIVQMGRETTRNALEGARLYALLGQPTIIASGGIVRPGSQRRSESEALAEGLVTLGVPRDRIVLESRSRNTRENAMYSAELLRARGVRRFVLVTSAIHMPRAVADFRSQGLEPIPSSALLAVTTADGLSARLQPSYWALRQSDQACYEYLARLYYWAGGR